MLGNRGFGFNTGCYAQHFFFFNLVEKNSLIVKKSFQCRENGIDRFTKRTTPPLVHQGSGSGPGKWMINLNEKIRVYKNNVLRAVGLGQRRTRPR